MDDFRGRGFDRGNAFRSNRSRPAQRRTFGRARSTSKSSRPPPSEEQYQAKLQQQPQKREALESIQQYEQKKQDPAHRDVSLGQFFQEWTELLRANVVGEINDFEDNAINKYTTALTGLDDMMQLQPPDRREIVASSKAGMLLATSIRLLRTVSATQKGKDIAMIRMLDEVSELEVPTFYNAILSNIGKFSDENFGNFRIQSPILMAKRRIMKAMSVIGQYAEQDFSLTPGKKSDAMMNLIGDGQKEFIFQDADSVAYLKFKGKQIMKESLKERFLIKIGTTSNLLVSFPFFDIDTEFGVKTAAEYILLIAKFTDTIAGDVNQHIQTKRDIIIACILFQLANESFLEDVDLAIKVVFDYLGDDQYKFFNTITIRELLKFSGLVYMGDFLNTRRIISNARVVYQHYLTKAYPYIKRNFKVNQLTNYEFGTAAQFIEKDFQKGKGDRIEFHAISKFKDKALNVFGGVMGFYKKLSFKREIVGNLAVSEDAILNTFISKDIKYLK